MSDATIEVVHEGGVARLVLSNRARRNAMTMSMWRALPDLVGACEADGDVRVVVLEGGGDTFCSGADISEFETRRADADAAGEYEALVAAANAALLRCAKPTVALVRGVCYGGGVGLALACDLRLARADARFRIPAARLGLGYSFHNVELVAGRIGAAATTDLLFTARTIDAGQALSDGLVRHVFAQDAFEDEARAIVAAISSNAPLTLAAAKAALVELARAPAERDRARVAALVARCMASEDYAEGRRAFAQRRAPTFRGA